MQTLIIKAITLINNLNEILCSPFDNIIDSIPLEEWIIDALKDSIHMVPFLFFIFIVIELIEFFYSNKMTQLSQYTDKAGPLIGSLAATFPQCGFSVIASTLYTKNLITRGTLLAVFLSTSDEAIPVILSYPSKIHLVIPILFIKIFIGVVTGYFIDFIFKKCRSKETNVNTLIDETEEGCCKHHITKPRKRDLLLHPIEHTLNVFIFILIVTIGINWLIQYSGGEDNLGQYFLYNSVWQPVFTAIAGLIPNCAVSIAITLMYLKGAIGFGAVISGLCSGAGLGVLVLLKKNESLKDSVKILMILLAVSIFWGVLIQTIYN